MNISDYDIIRFRTPFPTLFNLACCKVVTNLWNNSLATYRTPNKHGKIKPKGITKIPEDHKKLINELPDVTLTLKDKLLALDKRVATNVTDFRPHEYCLPEYSKLFLQFDHLADIDLVKTVRSVFGDMEMKGYSNPNRFMIACSIANRELIDEAWEALTLKASQECRSVIALILDNYNPDRGDHWIIYFAEEKLGTLPDLDSRARIIGMSAVFWALKRAIIKNMLALVKYFMPLLSANEQKCKLPTQLLLAVRNSHSFASINPHRTLADRYFTTVFFILQNMDADNRESFIKDNAAAIIVFWKSSPHYNYLVMPLARKVFKHLTIDDYRLCLRYFRQYKQFLFPDSHGDASFITFVRNSPAHLKEIIYDKDFYLELYTNLDNDLELLRGRPNEVMMIGPKLCAAWIDKQKWVNLHVFMAELVPDEQRDLFEAMLERIYCKSLKFMGGDRDRKWATFQMVSANVAQKLDSRSSNYSLDNGHCCSCGRVDVSYDFDYDVFDITDDDEDLSESEDAPNVEQVNVEDNGDVSDEDGSPAQVETARGDHLSPGTPQREEDGEFSKQLVHKHEQQKSDDLEDRRRSGIGSTSLRNGTNQACSTPPGTVGAAPTATAVQPPPLMTITGSSHSEDLEDRRRSGIVSTSLRNGTNQSCSTSPGTVGAAPTATAVQPAPLMTITGSSHSVVSLVEKARHIRMVNAKKVAANKKRRAEWEKAIGEDRAKKRRLTAGKVKECSSSQSALSATEQQAPGSTSRPAPGATDQPAPGSTGQPALGDSEAPP